MESILSTIKKMLGLDENYDAFDTDIIVNINMVFNILNQIGVGPDEGFYINGYEETWADYVSDMRKLQMVKTYVYLKVKQIFDPGTSSALNTAIDNQIKELEWRLSIQVDPKEITESMEDTTETKNIENTEESTEDENNDDVSIS